jgi:hypothetical protein
MAVANPEKRKVGGSTPPLTTLLEQRKRCSCHFGHRQPTRPRQVGAPSAVPTVRIERRPDQKLGAVSAVSLPLASDVYHLGMAAQ